MNNKLGHIFQGANSEDRGMLGWTNGFFHKATLTKIGLVEEDAEKFMAKFDKMVQNKKKVVILI